MKKILIIFAFPVFCLSAPHFQSVSKEMVPVVNKVLYLPEACQLLERVNREGGVSVVGRSQLDDGMTALWQGEGRRILVGGVDSRSEASRARSLLMEMHNASTDCDLARLCRLAREGKITKGQYVEGVERIEHQNLLNTLQLMREASRRGIFPFQASWCCPKRFEDYFQIQKCSGHSGWIARNYDRIRRTSKA